jgi:hypothetical protein
MVAAGDFQMPTKSPRDDLDPVLDIALMVFDASRHSFANILAKNLYNMLLTPPFLCPSKQP